MNHLVGVNWKCGTQLLHGSPGEGEGARVGTGGRGGRLRSKAEKLIAGMELCGAWSQGHNNVTSLNSRLQRGTRAGQSSLSLTWSAASSGLTGCPKTPFNIQALVSLHLCPNPPLTPSPITQGLSGEALSPQDGTKPSAADGALIIPLWSTTSTRADINKCYSTCSWWPHKFQPYVKSLCHT